MTKHEFDSLTRGMAYQTMKFERGEIDGKEYAKFMRMSLGKDAFRQAKEIEEEVEGSNK
jgi:hypothetical protein